MQEETCLFLWVMDKRNHLLLFLKSFFSNLIYKKLSLFPNWRKHWKKTRFGCRKKVHWTVFSDRKSDADEKQPLRSAVVATARGNTTNLFDRLNHHHRALQIWASSRRRRTISGAAPHAEGRDQRWCHDFSLRKKTRNQLTHDPAAWQTGFIPSRSHFSAADVPELHEKHEAGDETEPSPEEHYADSTEIQTVRLY